MTEPAPLDTVLGSGAGGPLSPPTPWIQYTGYLNYSGGVVVGVPSGGNKGSGAINAQALFVNGVQLIVSNYLAIAGGTMTGVLTLAQDPVNPLDAADKRYVDAKSGAYLPLAGGTLTGPLVLAADPTAALGATTKQYSDTKIPFVGGTMTGLLILSGNPTAALGAVPKQYVDNAIAGVNTSLGNYLPLAGGTVTGNLTINGNTVLSADPTTDLQAATKHYVDGKTSQAISIPDAPSDGTTYGRNNAAWVNTIDAGAY
jgi:hypothetical protein